MYSNPSLVLEEAHHCAADTNSHYYSGNNHSRYATYIHTNSITHVAILMSMNHILKSPIPLLRTSEDWEE